MITKIFAHYEIPLEITDTIQTTFKSKLHRMGKSLSMTGVKKRSQLLNQWKDSVWEFKISKVELNNVLKTRKHKFEARINEEVLKQQKLENVIILELIEEWTKLEKEVIILKDTNKLLSKITEPKKVHSNLKLWNDCSRQHKFNSKKP